MSWFIMFEGASCAGGIMSWFIMLAGASCAVGHLLLGSSCVCWGTSLCWASCIGFIMYLLGGIFVLDILSWVHHVFGGHLC